MGIYNKFHWNLTLKKKILNKLDELKFQEYINMQMSGRGSQKKHSINVDLSDHWNIRYLKYKFQESVSTIRWC